VDAAAVKSMLFVVMMTRSKRLIGKNRGEFLGVLWRGYEC
jgi:hypothetical protein